MKEVDQFARGTLVTNSVIHRNQNWKYSTPAAEGSEKESNKHPPYFLPTSYLQPTQILPKGFWLGRARIVVK